MPECDNCVIACKNTRFAHLHKFSKKWIAINIALFLLLIVAGDSHVYPFGWYWNLPGNHWCGIEVEPTFGVFCDIS